jgi:hypothetical protein
VLDSFASAIKCLSGCGFELSNNDDGQEQLAALLHSERRIRASIDEIESEDEPNSSDMLDAWQSVLALAERSLGRAHAAYRHILTHIKACLLHARKIIPALRVQLRILASVACGLSGYGSRQSNSSFSSSDSGSSISTSSTNEIAKSSSALVDATMHAEVIRTFASFPSFFLASQCEQFADLMSLVAQSVRKQEEAAGQSQLSNNPMSAQAMTADVCLYYEQVRRMFEIIGGYECEQVESLECKLKSFQPDRVKPSPACAVEPSPLETPFSVLTRSIQNGSFSGLFVDIFNISLLLAFQYSMN